MYSWRPWPRVGETHPQHIAALISDGQQEEAEHALQNALSVEDRNRLKDFCGSIPSIMGRCVFSNQDSIAKSSPRVTPHLHFFQERTFCHDWSTLHDY